MSNPVAEPVTARPAICLNMIARNEAHVVAEVLDAVAPYISSWVIVDTGSDDGTQDLIRNHMAGLGIPGELHERPWRNFGHNRSEALTLAQGHGDYIWVMDADDTLVGTPDFNGLDADIYFMRIEEAATCTYWRPQVFRVGASVRYAGVVHEYATWDGPCLVRRLEGDYHIESRHIGARNLDPQRYARDRDLLLAEVERNPEDDQSVFFLAQSYFCLGDFGNARAWYARRTEMGGSAEQVYYAYYQVAVSMSNLGAPWSDIQDAYLRAWECRPTRAEPLYSIGHHYREEQRYRLGYLFAERAAKIPFPDEDIILVRNDIYGWRALDEQAVCASWIGKQPEAFALWRKLLDRNDIPDADRQRIAGNRDVCVPTMLEAAAAYPDALVAPLERLVAGDGDGDTGDDVVVSLIAGPDRAATEQTLNSFLRCCLDVSRVGRFLVLDAGLSPEDRTILLARYGFLEFAVPSTGTHLTQLRSQTNAPYWLHLGAGWRFFAPENFIARLTAVLEAESQVFQVGINFADAVTLTGTAAAQEAVRRTPDGGRYVLTDAVASGPAMFDTARLDQSAGLRTASLDEVLCIGAV